MSSDERDHLKALLLKLADTRCDGFPPMFMMDLRSEELLTYVDEAARDLLKETFAALVKAFPQVRHCIVMPGIQCFVSEDKVVAWLYSRMKEPQVTVDSALDALSQFYLMTEVDVRAYVFFSGADAFAFGNEVRLGRHTVGRPKIEGPLLDGRFVKYRLSAQDFCIKVQTRQPIWFVSDETQLRCIQEGKQWARSIPHDLVLQPLELQLRLLEADLQAPLWPFSYYLRFDWDTTPLSFLFDRTSDLAGGEARTRLGQKPDLMGERLLWIWRSYDNLPETTKSKLGLPLRWISRSLHETESIDRMIAVGVALEALYLDQDIKEQQRYRISLNGSLWLESDLAQRRGIARQLKNAYDIRSKSVHAATHDVSEQEVDSARDLAARGVFLALERGSLPENWNEWIQERFPASH